MANKIYYRDAEAKGKHAGTRGTPVNKRGRGKLVYRDLGSTMMINIHPIPRHRLLLFTSRSTKKC